MADLAEQKAIAENELDTVLGAKKFISAAMENMTTKYLGRTRDGFAKYREMIEGDGEREFLLDTSFALSVTDGGATHPEEAYSRGTRDLYAIATRLALSDALYIGELPPIILDDPFTALDDARLGRALRLIEKIAKERQVLYFTCQKSRKP
jgi:DNA repair exonuclease SbcCD ATPase subunit